MLSSPTFVAHLYSCTAAQADKGYSAHVREKGRYFESHAWPLKTPIRRQNWKYEILPTNRSRKNKEERDTFVMMNITTTPLLPPGFRFHPTDQELIIHYLKEKLSSSQSSTVSIIADVDLYRYNPWELPEKACFGESEWFFFSPRDRKYPNGVRPNRAAGSGYWKATGTDKPILESSGSQCLGVKKALVFYRGRPPKGAKTDWVMHEYRLLESSPQRHKGSMRLDDWVLCRVRQKSSMPLQMGDKQEISITDSHPDKPNQEKPAARRRRETFQETHFSLSDYSHLKSQEADGGGGGGCSNIRQSYQAPPKPPNPEMGSQYACSLQPQSIPSVQHLLDSMIPRTLSFGVLDDYMLLPPSKRLNISGSIDELSLAESTCIPSCHLSGLVTRVGKSRKAHSFTNWACIGLAHKLLRWTCVPQHTACNTQIKLIKSHSSCCWLALSPACQHVWSHEIHRSIVSDDRDRPLTSSSKFLHKSGQFQYGRGSHCRAKCLLELADQQLN
ncbi:hypothetical protein ACLOJK_010390 [Asimina triloba]